MCIRDSTEGSWKISTTDFFVTICRRCGAMYRRVSTLGGPASRGSRLRRDAGRQGVGTALCGRRISHSEHHLVKRRTTFSTTPRWTGETSRRFVLIPRLQYTIQPVVIPVVSCKQTSSRLSKRLSNRFHNRLDVCLHDTAGCQTGCQTGLTTG